MGDAHHESAGQGDRPSHTSAPRWVTRLGIGLLLLVLLVILKVTGAGGGHGPGRHGASAQVVSSVLVVAEPLDAGVLSP